MAYFIPAPTAFPVVPDFSSNPFVTGFELAVTGNFTFTVQPGAARALTSDFVIEYPSFIPNLPAVITADVSTVGLNGCFPHSIASLGLADHTMFGVYIIANSAGTTGGSLNSNIAPAVVVATGNNFLPAGYDVFRRIGYVLIDDANGHLIFMEQSGRGNDRQYHLNAGPLAVSAGNATIATSLDLTAGDGVVPPGAGQNVILGLVINGNAANAYLRVYPTGNTVGNGTAGLITPVATQTLAAEGELNVGVNNIGNASIDYLVNNAGTTATIVVNGFVDSLGADLF